LKQGHFTDPFSPFGEWVQGDSPVGPPSRPHTTRVTYLTVSTHFTVKRILVHEHCDSRAKPARRRATNLSWYLQLFSRKRQRFVVSAERQVGVAQQPARTPNADPGNMKKQLCDDDDAVLGADLYFCQTTNGARDQSSQAQLRSAGLPPV